MTEIRQEMNKLIMELHKLLDDAKDIFSWPPNK